MTGTGRRRPSRGAGCIRSPRCCAAPGSPSWPSWPSPGRATRTSVRSGGCSPSPRWRRWCSSGPLVSYLVTGYHVVGRELRVYEGLLSRRTRAIPLERLQAVELVQPLLARLFGLAELRLEVVGACKTEAPLAFLRLDEARRCAQRLLALAQIGRRPRAAGSPTAGRRLGRRRSTARRAPRWPRSPRSSGPCTPSTTATWSISQLLRPQWWALPLAIAAPIFFFAFEGDMTFIAVASTVDRRRSARSRRRSARCSATGGSRSRAALDGLRLRRGLLETRSQTVPPGRIQAVAVQWPLLWRGHGWVRVQHGDRRCLRRRRQPSSAAGLLPVGTVPVAEQVIAEVLPGFVLTERGRAPAARTGPVARAAAPAGARLPARADARSSPGTGCSPASSSSCRTSGSRACASGRARCSGCCGWPASGPTPPAAASPRPPCTSTSPRPRALATELAERSRAARSRRLTHRAHPHVDLGDRGSQGAATR